MGVTKQYVQNLLPAYRDEFVTVVADQEVSDIITDIVKAHEEYTGLYDAIGPLFIGSDIYETCDNLYRFCEQNIKYKEETEHLQTVGVPQGILHRGVGDCKHFASFIGGCLGAIERYTGQRIDWYYCFASYKPNDPTPYHVFIVVEKDGEDIFIDPTPGARNRIPLWIDKQFVTKQKRKAGAVGAVDSSLNVAPGKLPLPDSYPSNLPVPFIENGRLTLTPVPPNFQATPEQLAWIIVALQLWIYAYSPAPYNVTTGATNEDGLRVNFLSSYVNIFLKWHRNPQIFNNGSYGFYDETKVYGKGGQYTIKKTWVPVATKAAMANLGAKAVPAQVGWGLDTEEMNFLELPDYKKDFVDDIIGIIDFVFNKIALLVPVVGTAYLLLTNYFTKQALAENAATQEIINQYAGEIAQHDEVVKNAAAATAKTNNYLWLLLLAAGGLLWYYWDDIDV